MTTFVSIGNAHQPFARLLEAIKAVRRKLPPPVIVQHGHTPFSDEGFEAVPFMGMEEFARRLADAELVVIHAGAGSILQAVEQGKVPIVMPRRADCGEHVNDHQVALARALGDAGKVVLVNDAQELEAGIDMALVRQHQARAAQRNDVGTEKKLISALRQVLAEYA